MLGTHVLKTWSKTQSVIAKSSAESELYAAVRASTEALGLLTLFKDVGMPVIDSRVHVDTSIAKSIVEREGLGNFRHIEVDLLWIQEQQLRRRHPLTKIDGTRNPADLMTKNLIRANIVKNLNIAGLEERDGRSDKAAQLHSVKRVGLQCWTTKLEDIASKNGDQKHDPDHWISRGDGGIWSRCHNQPRISVFTPYRVPKGLPKTIQLSLLRRTRGTFVSGEPFCVEDQWMGSATAHRFLKDAWVGVTEFVEDIAANPTGACTTSRV